MHGDAQTLRQLQLAEVRGGAQRWRAETLLSRAEIVERARALVGGRQRSMAAADARACPQTIPIVGVRSRSFAGACTRRGRLQTCAEARGRSCASTGVCRRSQKLQQCSLTFVDTPGCRRSFSIAQQIVPMGADELPPALAHAREDDADAR